MSEAPLTRPLAQPRMAASAVATGRNRLRRFDGHVSFAHEDTRTPMYTALCGLAAAVTGAVVLFPRYGIVGIAGAIALSGWVGATLLAVTLWRRGWLRLEGAALYRLPRLLLATAVMGSQKLRSWT